MKSKNRVERKMKFNTELKPQQTTHPHKLTDITLEDSGSFRCDVRGPSNSVLLTLSHHVFVIGRW